MALPAQMHDNNREPAKAFTVCRVQLRDGLIRDVRQSEAEIPAPIAAWFDLVAPHIGRDLVARKGPQRPCGRGRDCAPGDA